MDEYWHFEKNEHRKLSVHFNSDEFQCKCGKQHSNVISKELVNKLEKLRILYGKIIVVNSGYRCQEHNKAIGGASRSQHMLGNAADIVINPSNPENPDMVAVNAASQGLRVGLYDTFTHCDVSGGKNFDKRKKK